jgi:MFS family permease
VFRPFLCALRVRGVGIPLIAGFLGALPIGMLGLGVLLLVRATTGSFGWAGVASGALSLGNAAGLAVSGRLIDRYGQSVVLLTCAGTCPLALIALTVAATRHGPVPLVVALAATAGASLPPTTTSMRLVWPRLVTDARLRATAYALLATQFQVAVVLGPLLVSGLIALAGPAPAVLVAAGLAGTAGLLFASAPASRRWQSDPAQPARRDGGSTGAGLHTLVAASFGGGVAAGMLAVDLPVVAATQHSTALVGLLFAGYSAGELVGGLVYGGRSWRWPAAHRLLVGQAGAAAGVGSLVPLTGHPAALLPVMALIGGFSAPVSIAYSALLDEVAPVGALARSYTVMVAAGLIGAAAGNAAGGVLSGAIGSRPVLLIAAATLAIVAVWTWARRRTLKAPTLIGGKAGAG